MQRAVEAGPRNLPKARLQGGSVQENENLEVTAPSRLKRQPPLTGEVRLGGGESWANNPDSVTVVGTAQSVNTVESFTGYDFFGFLDDSEEEDVEDDVEVGLWVR